MTSPVRVAVPVALMVFTMIVVYGALEMSDSGKSAIDILWDMMYGKKGNSQEIELETLVQEENEKRSREMPDESLEAVNCVGDWSGTWSGCSEDCGPGSQTMDWVVSTDEINNGTCANRGTTKSQDCKIKECTANEAVNCVGDWSGTWSRCSEDCGPGSQTMDWVVSTNEINNGTCDNRGTTKSQDCKIKECPVNCVLGDFSDWGDCEYNNETGDYVKKQTRTTTTPALNGGTECGPLIEEQTCPAVNCVQSDFSDWGECEYNNETGNYVKKRTRTTTTPALNGGTECGLEIEEQTCPAVNCVGDWGDWGDCSKTCGTGRQTKTWKVTSAAQHGGTCANKNTTKSQDCNTQACTVNEAYPGPYTARKVFQNNYWQWQMTDSNGVEPPYTRKNYLVYYIGTTEYWMTANSNSWDRTGVTWSNPSSLHFTLVDGDFVLGYY